MSEKMWIIYDERAYHNKDDACVMSAISDEEYTLEDVIKERDEDFPNCPIFEYDVKPNDNPKSDGTLFNGKLIEVPK